MKVFSLPSPLVRLSGAGGQTVRDLALLLGATGVLLALAAPLVDLSRLHLGLLSFNDQVGYVAIARRLLDEGSLNASIIYPSTLLQGASRDYLYMPGHYFVLAASYFLFGFGAWQSLLPNLAAYALSALGVYLIAQRLYDRNVGLTAAILFLLFPPNIVYAFSAMSEMTRLAASVLAVGVFVYLPPRWRFWSGPWLLAIPVFFRETELSLLPLMALLLNDQPLRARLGQTLAFCGLAVLVSGLLLSVGPAAGRPTLLYSYVFDESYATMQWDAVALQAVSSPDLGDWLTRLPLKGWEGLASLITQLSAGPLSFLAANTWLLLGATAVAVFGSLKWRDRYFAGVTATVLVRLLFLSLLYFSFGFGWLRMLLTLSPLLAIALAVALKRLIVPSIRFRGAPQLVFKAACLFAAGALGCLLAVRAFFQPAANQDARAAQRIAWLEKLGHDDTTLLVSDVEFLHYVHDHYPVKWAFVPSNLRTLELLAAKYPIGTLLLPKDRRNRLLSEAELATAGLMFEQQLAFGDIEYLVYRAAPPATTE